MSNFSCIFFTLMAIATLGLSHDVINHIGIITIPEFGHFHPARAIAEYVHTTHPTVKLSIYTTGYFSQFACDETTPWKCVVYGEVNVSDYLDTDFFETLSMQEDTFSTFEFIQKHVNTFHERIHTNVTRVIRETAPDILLVDVGMYSGLTAAHELNIPFVFLYPLTLFVPFQSHTAFSPSMGLALKASQIETSLVTRYFNHLYLRLMIPLATTHQVTAPMRAINPKYPGNGGMWTHYPIVTPNIFGLDYAQPLCPNVRPVGFLLPTSDMIAKPSDEIFELKTKSLLYVNMGSVGKLSARAVETIYEAIQILLAANDEWSVIWKYRGAHAPKNVSTDRFLLTEFLYFSPRLLLHKYNESMIFATHCGDTSVYESVEATVPMVGLPLFADQPDMCQRVHEAGIGISMTGRKNVFTAQEFVDNVREIRSPEKFKFAKAKLSQLRAMGFSLGGAKRVYDTFLEVMLWKRNSTSARSHLACPHYDEKNYVFWSGVDIVVLDLILIYVLYKVLATISSSIKRLIFRK
eukprot:PhF_6_TR12925/c0_g1_i1/m.20392/K00699/UGT; glucuronosyltransferase